VPDSFLSPVQTVSGYLHPAAVDPHGLPGFTGNSFADEKASLHAASVLSITASLNVCADTVATSASTH
jgi:hypothetical protein